MPEILLILLSAILAGLSRLPLHTGWLVFFAYIPLLFYFNKSNTGAPIKGTATGRNIKKLLLHAFIYSAVNISLWMHWIWGVTNTGFVGIILLFTLYYFVLFLLMQLLWKRFPKLKYVSFVLLFICLEYLQNFGEWCFPWTNAGYALSDYNVLIQVADIGGVSFLSMFIFIINIFVYQSMQKKWKYGIGIIAIMLLWTGYGMWCFKTVKLEKKPAHIAIMQPSIPQEDKWESENFDQLYYRYADLTGKAAKDSAGLVIYPEAAMPVYLLREAGYKDLIQNLCNLYHVDIFTGFPDVLPAPKDYPGKDYYYNAATLFRPFHPAADPYYKIILVPVGERIPWLRIFPFLWKLQFGQANWEYGKVIRQYSSRNVVFSPQICFEIAFPELNQKMAFREYKRFGSKPSEKIDFLVNITNDAWFGKSSGPWIHGMMTKFRAVENRIQIYRSANTGISMVVDPMGRIIHRTKLFEITQFQAPLYISHKLPLYYYLSGWERILYLLTIILIILAFYKGIKPSGKD